MRVLVTGGTGFVGVPVCRALRSAGHAVIVVSRRPEAGREDEVGWEQVPDAVRAADAIVNLAGEPIADGRWTPLRKERIRESRVETTRVLVDAVAASSSRPSVLVNASAVGYYGSRGDEPIDETSEAGTGFLATVCQAWEQEAMRAEPLGLRVVRLRIGVVLANDGGALARMIPAFRAFLGGPLGNGRQWMSWIHRDDVVGLVLAAVGSNRLRGAVNATAPQPVTNREFAEALGHALGRPAFMRAPALALRLGLGEMADMLLTGQRVFPAAAERGGYRWRFPDLARALRAVTRR